MTNTDAAIKKAREAVWVAIDRCCATNGRERAAAEKAVDRALTAYARAILRDHEFSPNISGDGDLGPDTEKTT